MILFAVGHPPVSEYSANGIPTPPKSDRGPGAVPELPPSHRRYIISNTAPHRPCSWAPAPPMPYSPRADRQPQSKEIMAVVLEERNTPSRNGPKEPVATFRYRLSFSFAYSYVGSKPGAFKVSRNSSAALSLLYQRHNTLVQKGVRYPRTPQHTCNP
jgi:hypothetical protein